MWSGSALALRARVSRARFVSRYFGSATWGLVVALSRALWWGRLAHRSRRGCLRLPGAAQQSPPGRSAGRLGPSSRSRVGSAGQASFPPGFPASIAVVGGFQGEGCGVASGESWHPGLVHRCLPGLQASRPSPFRGRAAETTRRRDNPPTRGLAKARRRAAPRLRTKSTTRRLPRPDHAHRTRHRRTGPVSPLR